MNLTDRLFASQRHHSPWAATSVCLLLVAAVTIGDIGTGAELSFSIFYLAPIAVATWLVGRKAGLAVAVLAAIAWLGADYATHALYSSDWIRYWNAAVRFGFFVVVAFTMSSLRASQETQRKLATTDEITQLANRRLFLEALDREIGRADRYGHPLTVAFMDLDHFKDVNDLFGHAAGDRALRIVASLLRSRLRSTDIPARVGGDEFAVVLTETDAASALETLGHIHHMVNAAMESEGWPARLSTGLASFPADGTTGDAILAAADSAMYRAKHGGGSAVIAAGPTHPALRQIPARRKAASR